MSQISKDICRGFSVMLSSNKTCHRKLSSKECSVQCWIYFVLTIINNRGTNKYKNGRCVSGPSAGPSAVKHCIHIWTKPQINSEYFTYWCNFLPSVWSFRNFICIRIIRKEVCEESRVPGFTMTDSNANSLAGGDAFLGIFGSTIYTKMCQSKINRSQSLTSNSTRPQRMSNQNCAIRWLLKPLMIYRGVEYRFFVFCLPRSGKYHRNKFSSKNSSIKVGAKP